MQQEELMILNIYAPNTGTPRYIRLMKRLRLPHNNSETSTSIVDRSTRQKINKDIQHLNSDLEQVNLINIYRTFHFKYTKYTLLSVPHHNYSQV